MSNRKQENLFVCDQLSQRKIARLAVCEFRKTWNKNTHGRGDKEWLDLLRIDKKHAIPKRLSNKLISEFLTTYKIARDFPEKNRTNMIKIMEDFAKKEIPGVMVLAEKWKECGAKNSINISAASKFLFFMYPDHDCVIYDSKASLAIHKRYGVDQKNFPAFKEKVLEFDKFLQKFWKLYMPKMNCVPPRFISRRLTDKYLFIEGSLIEAQENVEKAIKCFKKWNFSVEGKNIYKNILEE